jgi:hypothetical protein
MFAFQVLYTFQAQIDGDLSVAEGEVVRIKEQHNADWVSFNSFIFEISILYFWVFCNVKWLNNFVYYYQSTLDVWMLQVIVENSFGEVGNCPGNHLDPNPDFCGRALFDIERLLSYKSQSEKPDPQPSRLTGPKPELKFFDPLCSPDDEMIRIEAELERKAREANSINVEQKIISVKQMVPFHSKETPPILLFLFFFVFPQSPHSTDNNSQPQS